MRIGDLAQQAGLKPSAIRFYEASGLLPTSARGANGYRLYGDAALKRLRMIQLAHRLGFGLDTLRELFAQSEDGLPQDQILSRLAARRAEIAHLRAELDGQEEQLRRLEAECRSQWAQGACVDLAAPRAALA